MLEISGFLFLYQKIEKFRKSRKIREKNRIRRERL
jgi:hypothetical protein